MSGASLANIDGSAAFAVLEKGTGKVHILASRWNGGSDCWSPGCKCDVICARPGANLPSGGL